MSKEVVLSVIVPCFNESEVIEETHAQLEKTLSHLNQSFEILYIDDGSSDDTLLKLRVIQSKSSSAKVIALSRNFGHQSAVSAGLKHCTGQAVVIIDADLQDPPELILEMHKKWKEGFEVVYATRESRAGEGLFKKMSASVFYRFLKLTTDCHIPVDTGDFRLMDRSVVDHLNQMPERHKFIRGLVAWVGFKQVGITYARQPRFAGTSKYTLGKMFSLAKEGVFSSSTRPLQFVSTLGSIVVAVCILGAALILFGTILGKIQIDASSTILLAVVTFSSIQIFMLMILGEYIRMLFSETKHRPNYLVAKTYGISDETENPQKVNPHVRRVS